MKNYMRPIAEVSKFDVADIITTSAVVMNAAALEGVEASLYADYANKSSAPNTNVAVFEW
jgi:hypothetical protein